MPKTNKSGDKRGMTPGSSRGLVKARKNRTISAKPRGRGQDTNPFGKKPDLPAPVMHFEKLIKGSKEQLHERIRDKVTLCENEPGALTATVLGTLMADLGDANDVIGKSWEWVKKFLEEDGDPRSIAPLLKELRGWMETMKDTAVKVAEMNAKNRDTDTGGGNPISKYEVVEIVEETAEESPDADLVTWEEPEKKEDDNEDGSDCSILD